MYLSKRVKVVAGVSALLGLVMAGGARIHCHRYRSTVLISTSSLVARWSRTCTVLR